MIRIVVVGLPGPQGSKKVVGHAKPKPGRKVGRAILVESSAKVRPWREAVKWAAIAAMNRAQTIHIPADARPGDVIGRVPVYPLNGPLVVRMVFTLPKPASAPKKRQTFPDRKPDLSKLVRSTEDALTDAGVWVDDARVVAMVAHKHYPNEGTDALGSPGCVIEIRPL